MKMDLPVSPDIRAMVATMAVVVLLGIGAMAFAATDVKSTTSNATVSEYAAIALSTNLTDGIFFGSVNPNTNDNVATHNADGADGNTSMWVTISSDSNTYISICTKDSAALTKGADTIPNTGYTYNFTTTAADKPVTLPGTAITTSYVNTTGVGVSVSDQYEWFRFWLDVPAGQEAGVYENTMYFKGITTSEVC